jgi:hypothetical protein
MPETEYIIADLYDARDAMDRDLRALRSRLKQETNPRVQAERHPFVVAGLVAGIVLAAFFVVKVLRRNV